MNYYILGTRRLTKSISVLSELVFVLIGLVSAAVDAAPGAGVCTQLHGQSPSGRLTASELA